MPRLRLSDRAYSIDGQLKLTNDAQAGGGAEGIATRPFRAKARLHGEIAAQLLVQLRHQQQAALAAALIIDLQPQYLPFAAVVEG